VLHPPRLRPRYLEFAGASQRLDEVMAADDLFGLIGDVA
jgi:hypothetical protein